MKKRLQHRRRSGVFIVNFEHISHLVLVFLLLTLIKCYLGDYICEDFYQRCLVWSYIRLWNSSKKFKHKSICKKNLILPNLSTLSLALGAGIYFFDFTLVPALFMEWLIVHNLILIKSFLIVPITSYQS